MINFIAEKMLLDPEFLLSVSRTASYRYKTFYIKKKNGKKRKIYSPSKELKAIQRVILDNVLVKLPVSNHSYAYRKHTSTKNLVHIHKNNKYFLRIDIKDFFYSIKRSDINEYLTEIVKQKIIDLKPIDINFLLDIICFHDQLVIGAVTSPSISNAICFEFDNKVSGFCKSKNIVYTRYADDLIFSTKEKDILKELPNELTNLLRSIRYPKGLYINHSKTINSSKKRKVSILGLNITSDNKISIGKKKKRYIKSLIYKWDSLSPTEKMQLRGYLAYCRSVEPSFINNLCLKYGSELLDQIIHNGI